MSGWRVFALALGGAVTIVGALVWGGGGPVMVFVFGALIIVTAALEPIYGRADGRPSGAGWRCTDECFVDPDTGRLVKVWFDSDTGERRYVDASDAAPPT